MRGLPQKQNARRADKIRLCGHLGRYKKIVKKTYIISFKGFAEIGEETRAFHANRGVPSCMSGNKQSGMKEKTAENTKKRGNTEMKTELQKQLFALQDPGYREFHARLIPGIPKEDIIGIRTPVLRKFAGKFARDHSQEAEAFLKELPHRYYEENNLHMLLVTKIEDYPECLRKVKEFLPYINNWATCDLPAPKCFEEYREELLPVIREWLLTTDTYTIRYGIGLLMRLYLDDMYRPEYADLVARVRSEEYYVNMMIAWYFATALAKQWDTVIPYLEERKLDRWVHQKTIQKAVESFRITPEQKVYLKSLRYPRK